MGGGMRVGEGACRAWCACEGRCGWVEVWAQESAPMVFSCLSSAFPPLPEL